MCHRAFYKLLKPTLFRDAPWRIIFHYVRLYITDIADPYCTTTSCVPSTVMLLLVKGTGKGVRRPNRTFSCSSSHVRRQYTDLLCGLSLTYREYTSYYCSCGEEMTFTKTKLEKRNHGANGNRSTKIPQINERVKSKYPSSFSKSLASSSSTAVAVDCSIAAVLYCCHNNSSILHFPFAWPKSPKSWRRNKTKVSIGASFLVPSQTQTQFTCPQKNITYIYIIWKNNLWALMYKIRIEVTFALWSLVRMHWM